MMARMRFEPGWHWSKHVSPIAGTQSCQHRHVGYCLSGSLLSRMEDGTEIVVRPGDAYEVPPGHDAWVVGDVPFEAVEWTSASGYGLAPDTAGERVLATILFSDIVDSTPKVEKLGDHAWSALVREHNTRIRAVIDKFQGRESATLGDGFMALFNSPASAVRAARLMNAAVSELELKLRIGVHTGEVEFVGGEVRGVAVHMAARVAAVAGADEVLVSSLTRELLDGSELQFDAHGEHMLKGLSGKRALFKLRLP